MNRLLKVYLAFNSVTKAGLHLLLQPNGESLHLFYYSSAGPFACVRHQTSVGPRALKFVSKVHQSRLEHRHTVTVLL